jgi:hypothetical protein
VKPAESERIAEVRQAIVSSIERGMPVQYGSEEDGLIFGYRKEGVEWFAFHPIHDGGSKAFVETEWPWAVVVYGPGAKQPPTARELAPAAIEQAVLMAHAAEANGYHLGFDAWRAYIARLRYLATAVPEARAGDMMGNAWIYECLAGFRSSAATYLRTVAPEFPAGVSDQLRAAARLYEQMSHQVLRDEEHGVVAVAPYPWSLSEGETWTEAAMKGQIERLEAALPIEQAAIATLEAALAEMEASA